MRMVVRSAYSGRFAGFRLIAKASGASIRTNVPRAACATAINAANTHRMAAASHRFSRGLPGVKAGWTVTDIWLERGLRRAQLLRGGAASHARPALQSRDGGRP